MKIELIPHEGSFYKVNMHCHTNISDGALSPEEVKENYKKMGYHAVCFTDHEVLIGQEALCDDEFIALHGYEVAIKQRLDGHTGLFMPVYHFNIIAEKQDAKRMPRCFVTNPSMPGNAGKWFAEQGVYDENDVIDTTEYSIEWLNNYLTAVRDAGFLITYNHPQWSLQNSSDYIGLEGLHAIEAFNGGCYVLGDTSTSIHYEQMLRNGMDVIPVGGDDNHGSHDQGRAWTMIKAKDFTYDALMEAYKRGDCYATCGPEIKELYMEDGKIFVKTSQAKLITLRTEGRHSQIAKDTDVATFSYAPEKFGRYFRIEVKDENGGLAFSKAYYTADMEA